MPKKPTYEELEQRVEKLEKAESERKHAAKQLLQSEKKLRTITDTALDSIFCKDINRKYTFVNPSMLQLLECTKEDLIGKVPEEVFDKEEAAIVAEVDERTLNGENVDEVRSLSIAGKSYTFNTIQVPLRDSGGNITGISGIVRDITDFVQAEEALRESEEKYRAIFENIQDVYFESSLDGVILELSPSIESISKYKRDELIGKSVYDLYTNPDERDELIKVILAKGRVNNLEINLTEKDGSQILCSIDTSVIVDEQRNPLKFVGSIRDITERKRVEEALRKSEEKYRGIFDESIAAVYLFGDKKIFLDSNQAGLDLLGYSREELLNMSIPDVDADPIVVLPAHEQLLSGERIINYEHRLKRKDGRVITVLNNSRPITDTNGHVVGMQSTLIDITERKETEEALQKAHSELEQRVEERTSDLELKTKSLEELNTAMKVLLKKREKDKIEIEENVMTNVKELISPYFDKIKKTELDDHQEAFLNILESNLNEIVSPFTRKLSLKYLSLTPKEILIVNMIKIGYPSKKIAKIMKISPRTVDTHRKNIRGKIGLGKKRANLRSHLLAYEQ